MATWQDILQVGSYGGVAFDMVSARDEGSNELDKQAFPNRPGQRIQPKSQNGKRHSVMAIFIEEDYPATMNKLLAKLDDGGVVKEFVHPVFGSKQCACASFTVTHDAEDAIDSGTIEIVFEEHTEGPALLQATDTTPAHGNACTNACTTVLQALSAYQAAANLGNNPVVLQVQDAVNAAQDVSDDFTVNGDTYTALQVQAQANGVLALLDPPIESMSDYTTTEQFELCEALLALAAEFSSFSNDLINAKPPLTVFSVPADTNVLSFVHALYGSSDRADEFLALNDIPDPSLLPAGFKAMAYAA